MMGDNHGGGAADGAQPDRSGPLPNGRFDQAATLMGDEGGRLGRDGRVMSMAVRVHQFALCLLLLLSFRLKR